MRSDFPEKFGIPRQSGLVEELIPELQEGGHSNIGIIGVSVGFVLMMVLDVALG